MQIGAYTFTNPRFRLSAVRSIDAALLPAIKERVAEHEAREKEEAS